ncbi:MAG: hypothetical protein ACPG77_10920 [Nannocystaceae bacterium]
MSHETVTLTCEFNATGSLFIYRGTSTTTTWLNPEGVHLVEVDEPHTVDFVVRDPSTDNQRAHVWQRASFSKWPHDGHSANSAVFNADADVEFRVAVAQTDLPLPLDDFDGTLPGSTQSVKVKIKIRKKGAKPIS